MTQPPTYDRLTSFSNLTALSPSTPPPGNLATFTVTVATAANDVLQYKCIGY